SAGGIYALWLLLVVVLGALIWRSVRMALVQARRRAPLPGGIDASPAWTTRAGEAAGAQAEAPDRPLDRVRVWLRRAPSDPYLREPPRRLDRIDALLVLGLVLFAFVFRLCRL